ncbi:MAG TPA: hypothetical protein VLU43_05310 [Anaeromyxobacteraceae bacterium]|nr:hypothetical protein [Anaeromyxobacteraceae bacterium]
MADAGRGGGRTRAALGFALAGLAASWNPISAPLGLIVGLAAVFLSLRALAAGGGRRAGRAALAVSLLAVAASGAVLGLTAGVGRSGGTPIVEAPAGAEVERRLDAAAAESREARERARAELEALEPPSSAPGGGRAGGRTGGAASGGGPGR